MQILNQINSRKDLLSVPREKEEQLCAEIRQLLIEKISQTGGHLSSNLGIVELQVAIEKEFDTTTDRLVFDVGHQSYVHKILTGRKDALSTIRTLGGISGFPKPSESETDAFVAGHASNAVSVALGMARARTLRGENYHVIALLGDGAMTGGLFYEGMNDAGASGEPLIVILNDNEMSIEENVGGIAGHLKLLRTRPGYYKVKKNYRKITKMLPGGAYLYRFTHYLKDRLKHRLLGVTLFEEMGFEYIGPVDGHDITRLVYQLRRARESDRPVLVHVLTKKGKGYVPAEQNPDVFHGVGRFDPNSGKLYDNQVECFADRFGSVLCRLAHQNPYLCAITAAMRQGTGLEAFSAAYPERYFDVGIAEGHAVSMAGGLAKQKMLPVVVIYSTFLQRAYDMILQDAAMQHLHIVFAVDRAGLVGQDGETHHGIFDVAYLRSVPGMTILVPSSLDELEQMLCQAVEELDGPVVVRYPRGGNGRYTKVAASPLIQSGKDCTLVCYGTMINEVLDAADQLKEKRISVEILKLNCLQPLDLDSVCRSAAKTGHLIVAEETIENGCIGFEIAAELQKRGINCRVKLLNLGNNFVQHGTIAQLRELSGINSTSIAKAVQEIIT